MSAEYWVWLQQVLGTSADAVHRVIKEYGDAKNFYLADDDEKIERCRLTDGQAERLHKVSRKTVYNILKDCHENNIRIVTPNDEEFPTKLLNIPDPPCVLYIKGKPLHLNDVPVISIVGPRKITDYGKLCAEVISDTLASCGFVIVSGGALGGDSAAHRGCIKANGYTVAVLGGGIMSGYLKDNEDLRNEISKNGCLLSEDPPKTTVKRGTFPRRNRILSGIANGVVVIEADSKSGTLSTANHANEQGRDVFVIPGNPTLPQYEGANKLIFDGAKPLLNLNIIIDEYFHLFPKVIHKPKNKLPLPLFGQIASNITDIVNIKPKETKHKECSEPIPNDGLSENARLLLTLISAKGYESFYADELTDNSEFDAGTVLATLTELEIFGVIKSIPGGAYCLV